MTNNPWTSHGIHTVFDSSLIDEDHAHPKWINRVFDVSVTLTLNRILQDLAINRFSGDEKTLIDRQTEGGEYHKYIIDEVKAA